MNPRFKAKLEEARMGLSKYKVAAAIAVSDMDRARESYEGKLGLSVASTRATTCSSTGARRGP
jgi:hypothetical protein